MSTERLLHLVITYPRNNKTQQIEMKNTDRCTTNGKTRTYIPTMSIRNKITQKHAIQRRRTCMRVTYINKYTLNRIQDDDLKFSKRIIVGNAELELLRH